MKDNIVIDSELVRRLVATQFSQWKDLPVQPVAFGGWDNRTFHLGEHMLVRMPSDEEYVVSVEKEQRWLPKLAPLLPLPIPAPLAMGTPAEGYPWKWSIYRWIDGETAAVGQIADMCEFATSLAQFLTILQNIDATDGPINPWRGGDLVMYDDEMRQAITILKDKIDSKTATKIWEEALATKWQGSPVWIHGDVAVGNLLVKDGKLSAVIDFGSMGVGDPACDLVMTWTLFKDESREVFRKLLPLDPGTWARARAWALWKALIVCAGLCGTNPLETEKSWHVIDEVLADYL